MRKENHLCYLCENPIDPSLSEGQERLTRDHVPPKEFYPEAYLALQNLNLTTLPAHLKCNTAWKNDEEYVVAALLPHVLKSPCAPLFETDPRLRRAMKRPQGRKLAEMIRREFKVETEGGILLPPYVLAHYVDKRRFWNFILKMVKGVYFIEKQALIGSFLWNVEIHVYPDMPEPDTVERTVPARGSCPDVFSYKYFDVGEGSFIYMLFWRCILFRVAVRPNQ